MKVQMQYTKEVEINYLDAQLGVRYWEDAKVNGVEDENGDLIPCRSGDIWDIRINVDTGQIDDWPEDTTAQIHYKVCDAGVYSLVSGDDEVKRIEGYVPSCLSPGGNGYGDYVIMNVDQHGYIDNWVADIDDLITP